MYFDDTTNYFNDFTRWLHLPPNPEHVAMGLQDDAQHCERLLFTSGGALRAPKCFFYILDWIFPDDDSPPTLTDPDSEENLIFLTSGHDPAPQPITTSPVPDTPHSRPPSTHPQH
eukprot:scaffold6224_cov94-Cylindrotheca_fusiformis.AAC.2